jgi:hypothetical protein
LGGNLLGNFAFSVVGSLDPCASLPDFDGFALPADESRY